MLTEGDWSPPGGLGKKSSSSFVTRGLFRGCKNDHYIIVCSKKRCFSFTLTRIVVVTVDATFKLKIFVLFITFCSVKGKLGVVTVVVCKAFGVVVVVVVFWGGLNVTDARSLSSFLAL